MLDLNLGFVSSSSYANCNDAVYNHNNDLLHPFPSTIDSTGSFNSSSNLTAAGDDDDFISNTYDFLTPSNVVSGRYDHSDGRTIQLFPLEQSVRSTSSASSSSQKQWLGLASNSRLEMQPTYYAPVEHNIALQQQQLIKKSRRGPRSRSSQYRGVTFYRRTGRWESHIWDCGKQVYLGGFDTAQAAARAYDRAAIKFRGTEADINFNVRDYAEDIKQMTNFTKEEFVQFLRRQSSGFSRGTSRYRGVTLHKCGRWEARMGQFLGKKAYDKAAIKCNGREAATNFNPNLYDSEIIPEANNGGCVQSLDLNLGIAPPLVSEFRRDSMNVSSFPSPLGCNEIPLHRQAWNENSAPAAAMRAQAQLPLGSVGASGEPPIINSGFFPIHMVQERATEKRMDVNSIPNWTWQFQGGSPNAGATHIPLFSAAASSGFPSSTATTTTTTTSSSTSTSSAVTQLHFPNRTILHSHFSPPMTNNISHFYCRG